MKRCSRCGSENKDMARFCKDCGAPLPGNDRPYGKNDHPYDSRGERGKNYAYDGGNNPLPPPPAGNSYGSGRDHGYPDNSFREMEEDASRGKAFNRIIMVILVVLVIGALAVAGFAITRFLISRGGDSEKGSNKVESNTGSEEETEPEEEKTRDKTEEASTRAYDDISIPDDTSDVGNDTGNDYDGKDDGSNNDNSDQVNQGTDEDPYAGFIFPDSHERYLSQSEVSGLSKDDAQMAINEIYARKGWDFKKKNLKKHFQQYSWYQPVTRNEADIQFNKYEKANIDLLKKYR